jgi:hypothetical protein
MGAISADAIGGIIIFTVVISMAMMFLISWTWGRPW